MKKFKFKLSKKYRFGKQRKFFLLRHHPFIVPVIVLLSLFTATAVVYIFMGSQLLKPNDAHVVMIFHDKKRQIVPSRASTVGELLKQTNITINEGDVVEPSLDTPIVEDNFRVNVYRARPVTIIDNGHKTLAFNAASTPRSIASQAGITVYPDDNITALPVENILSDGIAEKVVIDRAQLANLNLYGTQVAIRSHAKTVGDLLKEKNVKLASDDTVTPSQATPISTNIQIFVTRNGTQIVTAEEAIAPDTEIIQDNSLSFGTTAIRQTGTAGKKLVTYQLTLQNGQEIGRTKIQEVIALPPVKKIIARGQAVSIPADKSGLMASAGIAVSDYPFVNYIVSRESGWCATKWQGEIGYCPAYYQEIHPITSGYGFGLCQSTPANKMASAGSDWQTNPVTQLKWCNGYAVGRYGGWEAAYNHWVNYNNW